MILNMRNVKTEYLQLHLLILDLKFAVRLLYNVYKYVNTYTLPLLVV